MVRKALYLALATVILTGCSSPGPAPVVETTTAVVETSKPPTPTATEPEPTSSPVPKVEGRLILPTADFDEPIADGHVEPDAQGVITPRTRTEVVEGRWGQQATVLLVHSDGSGPAPGDSLVTGKDGEPTPETGDPAVLPDGNAGTVGRVEIAPKSGLPEWFWDAVSDPDNDATYLVTCQPQEGRASSTSNVIVEITPAESR